MPKRRSILVPIADVIAEIEAHVDVINPSAKLRIARLIYPTLRDLNNTLIPNFATIKVAVETNGTSPMPADCITPVSAFLVRSYQGQEFLFRLGRRDANLPGDLEQIPVFDTEPGTISSDVFILPNYYNSEFYPFSLYNPNYGESYGRKSTRFYGWYGFSEIENRVEFTGIDSGEVVVITYVSTGDHCKYVPHDAVEMLTNRVLYKYFQSVDPSRAYSYRQEFRAAQRNYARLHNEEGYSYEDLLDALTSEYGSDIR